MPSRAWVGVVKAPFLGLLCATLLSWPNGGQAVSASPAAREFRVSVEVDGKGRRRSNSPVVLECDLQELLRDRGHRGLFDEHGIEVVSPTPRPQRMAHRLDPLFGTTRARLSFVMPNESCTNFTLYFDTVESHRGDARRYPGLLGDGDRFVEAFQRREIAASHFDCFVDFDGDGDLDLFKGGVEPFVYCFENCGRGRLMERGRLASGGAVFKLPCGRSQRSWVTVSFFDIDGDGDQDFFPSFGDGPDSGKIVFYRNVTREHGGLLTFERNGPLQTVSGVTLAGGAQAGGWFPSIAFVADWDGDGAGPDALVGSNHRCWLYRNAGMNAEGRPLFAEAIPVSAAGEEIVLVNPRFDAADVDGDGDLDLFAGTQPGPVYCFKNKGTHSRPELAPGQVVAWAGKYLIGDAHSGVKVADFDGDGLLDLASGRFWERAELNAPDAPHVFGGFWKNAGSRQSPRFAWEPRRGPFTEQFQLCDAVRQNGLRAFDWDNDGRLDLLAGDTDGFIWFFKNRGLTGRGESSSPAGGVFAAGEKLRGGGRVLTMASSGGHARFDVCDWNRDGRPDVVVADGSGQVNLFLNNGRRSKASLASAQRLCAGTKPLQLGARASVLVCDWNNDGRQDLVLADERGYYFCKNIGQDAAPSLDLPKAILFGNKSVRYVRPNLGSFVDWDGDGRRDLIACQFENAIHFYRNLGPGTPGEEPQFADPEGVIILQGESPQMISGVDVVDWNADGDLDLLTGQGHGGSGLRFYERDWLEDELHGTHPSARIVGMSRVPDRESATRSSVAHPGALK